VTTADAAPAGRAETRRTRPQEPTMSASPHHLTQPERTERAAARAEDFAFVLMIISGIALIVAILLLMLVL
jgi:hypothetical protein